MNPWWAVAIAASAGAGIIHLALGPEHLVELGGLGLGFYLAAFTQFGWSAAAVAALVARGGRGRLASLVAPAALRRLAFAGIAINVAILAAWAVSRTLGLPAGEMPWTPEAIGRADTICAVLQGGLVLGLIAWLRGPSAVPGIAGVRHPVLAALLAIAVIGAGTVFGLSGHAHGAGEDHHGAQPALHDAAGHDESVGVDHGGKAAQHPH